MLDLSKYVWSLRANSGQPKGLRKKEAEAFLNQKGWKKATDGSWVDPIVGDNWSTKYATSAQVIREAQVALEGLGYELTAGGSRDEIWITAWEVKKKNVAGYMTLTQALRRECLI